MFSDTHMQLSRMEKIILEYAEEVRIVCHLGDHANDLLNLQAKFPGHTFVAVPGNCDPPDAGNERVLAFSPCMDAHDAVARILLVHGHAHGVRRGLDRLVYSAKEHGATAAFFGHTHVPFASKHGGVFVMNPGSLTAPRGGSKASYGLVEVSPEGEISGKVIAYE